MTSLAVIALLLTNKSWTLSQPPLRAINLLLQRERGHQPDSGYSYVIPYYMHNISMHLV